MSLSSRLGELMVALGTDYKDLKNQFLSGSLASRPVPSSVVGKFYLVDNENGGTLYRSNGTAWVRWAPGVNEPSGEKVFNITSSTTSNVIVNARTLVTSMTHTFTSDGSPLEISFGGPLVAAGFVTAGTTITLELWDGPVATGVLLLKWTQTFSAGSTMEDVYKLTDWTPAVGQHTLNLSCITGTPDHACYFAAEPSSKTFMRGIKT